MRKVLVVTLLFIISIFAINLFIPQSQHVLSANQQVNATYNFDVITKNTQDYAQVYGVSLSFSPKQYSPSLSFEVLNQDDAASLHKYTQLFSEELSKYTKQDIAEASLSNVYFVKNLNITKGITSYPVAGATDYAANSIFIDITTNQIATPNGVTYSKAECEPTEFARGIFHHELWHIREAANPDIIAHDHSKEYSGQGLAVNADRCLQEGEFVSSYATTSPEEDRAEQFRAFMTKRDIK